MTDSHRLDALLAQVRGLGYWIVGNERDGDGALERFAAGVRELRERFPFVENDAAWLDFLARYGGATLSEAPHALSMGLYGLSSEASMHLLEGPGDPVDDGFLNFADVVFDREREPGGEPETVSLGFGFEATGQRPRGIYRIRGDASTWYGETFLDWLQRFVDRQGLLDD